MDRRSLKKDRFAIELFSVIDAVREQSNQVKGQLQRAQKEIRKLINEKEDL